MARPRSVSDQQVYDVVASLIRTGGEKAVTFSAVSERAGLAASSLAERYGSVLQMIAKARVDVWDRLDAATSAALAVAPLSAKGAIGVLKALMPPSSQDVQAVPDRAALWRQALEVSLAIRLGGGEGGKLRAGILVGYWLSQVQWRETGHPLPRLKDVLRILG